MCVSERGVESESSLGFRVYLDPPSDLTGGKYLEASLLTAPFQYHNYSGQWMECQWLASQKDLDVHDASTCRWSKSVATWIWEI